MESASFLKQLTDACSKGELRACKWLYTRGAASTIRTDGRELLEHARKGGQLDVAKWLFKVGAVEDIRTQDTDGQTLMKRVCVEGHLDVAKWLFKVGAAEDIRTIDKFEKTPKNASMLASMATSMWRNSSSKWALQKTSAPRTPIGGLQ